MSTFTLPGSDVTVKLVEGLSEEQLLEFPAFKVGTLARAHSPFHSYTCETYTDL